MEYNIFVVYIVKVYKYLCNISSNPTVEKHKIHIGVSTKLYIPLSHRAVAPFFRHFILFTFYEFPFQRQVGKIKKYIKFNYILRANTFIHLYTQ